MSTLLLDTGPVLHHLRNKQRGIQLVRGLSLSGKLSISAVTRIEVFAGMHPDERFTTRKLLSRFITLGVDRGVADRACEIVAILRIRGISIALADAVIAATAIAHSLTLVTFNRRHFESVPGISLYPLAGNGQHPQ